jgi:HAMP domain-containing protein
MTLRVRLLLGYGYLVALLLLASGSAMLTFLGLSERFDAVLEEDFTGIQAAMELLDSLERQDSVTLGALLEPDARAEMAEFEASFDGALQSLESHGESEQPLLSGLRSAYSEYRRARDQLIAAQPQTPLAAYREEVLPHFQKVKTLVRQVLDEHQRELIEAGRHARETAIQSSAWIGFLVTVALVSLVFLSRALQGQLLARLMELREATRAIAAGDSRRRLRTAGKDELAVISRNINEILDRLQASEIRAQTRVTHDRRLINALVYHLGPDAALFTASGDRVAGELDGDRELERGIAEWIRQTHGGEEESPTPAPSGLLIEPVRGLDGRIIAWLARRPG